MKRRNRLSMLIEVGFLLGAVGCGTTVSPVAVTTTETPSVVNKVSYPPIAADPFADPASDHEIVYSSDLVSYPLPNPPPDVQIDAAAARAVAAQNSASPSLEPGEPSTTLRMVKAGLPQTNPELRPAWILIFSNSHAAFHPPADVPTGEASAMASNAVCEMVVVVDAASGQTHGETQFCLIK